MRTKRIVAFWIDLVCIPLLILPFFALALWVKAINLSLFNFSLILSLIFCKDLIDGQSIGKRLMKLRAVNVKTQQFPGNFSVIIRNLFLCLWPFELFVLLITGNRRLGDYIAKTDVFFFESDSKPVIRKNQLLYFLICLGIVFFLVQVVMLFLLPVNPAIKLLFS